MVVNKIFEGWSRDSGFGKIGAATLVIPAKFLLGPVIPYIAKKCLSKSKPYSEFTELVKEKTVALVGNSPILDNVTYGPMIDSHDIVIRMNGGIIQDRLSANHTGLRTDIWASGAIHSVSNPDVQKSLNQIRSDLHAIFSVIPDRWWLDNNGIASLYSMMMFAREENIYYLPQAVFSKLVNGLVIDGKNANPTTGYRVFQSLLDDDAFSKLSLFGFSFSSDHRIFEPNLEGNHNFSQEEEQILGKVNQHSDVQLYR